MTQAHDATHQNDPPGGLAHKISAVKGLRTLTAAIVVIAIFITLNGLLGIADMCVGFLFALYWAGLQRSDFSKLPGSFFGAVIGISYAVLLRELPPLMGGAA